MMPAMTTPDGLTAAGGIRSVLLTLPQAPADEVVPAAPGWCRVRVHGPEGAVDVSVPTHRPVAEITGELVASLLPGAPLSSGGGAWHLHRLGRPALDPESTLGDALPRDGEDLHVTAGRVPEPAQRVDDALAALAEASSRAGRWTAGRLATAAGAAAVVASAGVALLLLQLRPAGPALPLLLATGLLTAALALRRSAPAVDAGSGSGSGAGSGSGSGAAALATLPAWLCAGLALARLLGTGALGALVLAALALALGAVVAVAAAPHLLAWWVLLATSGALAVLGGAVVASGLLGVQEAAAALGVVVLLVMAALPWAVARGPVWSAADVPAGQEEELARRGERTRHLLSAGTAAGAAAVSTCALVLAASGNGMQQWLAAVLAVLLVLRARRSRFVADSGPMLGGGLLVLVVLLRAVAVQGQLAVLWAVVAALVGVAAALLALVGAARRAADGSPAGLERLGRARVRRTLDVLEGLVAVAVLPLLAGALGVYAAAGDAGARL